MRFLVRIATVTLLSAVAAAGQDGGQTTPAQLRLQQRRMQIQRSFPAEQPVQAQAPGVYPTPTPPPQPPPQPRGGFQPQPVATPQPTPAPTPPLPELPPPVAPQVTYRDGLLTVQTVNSTLGGVLAAIRNKTGIQFEGLEGGTSERVALSLGPAPEGEVLAAILGGTRYDFVAIDRPDSPGIVQRVILSVRGGSSSGNTGSPGVASNSSAEGEDDEAEDTDPEGLKAPQDTPNRPPFVQAQQPQLQNNPQIQNNPQVEPGPDPQLNQQTPPSAEQLLKKLQDMGQQQAQPNPAPIKPPPQPPQPQ